MSERVITAPETQARNDFIAGIDSLDLPALSSVLWWRISVLNPEDIAQLPDDIRDLLGTRSIDIIALRTLDVATTKRSILLCGPFARNYSQDVTVWAHHTSRLTAEYSESQSQEAIPLYDDTEEGEARTTKLAQVLLQLARQKFSYDV